MQESDETGYQSSTNADGCSDARGRGSDDFGRCSYDRSDDQNVDQHNDKLNNNDKCWDQSQNQYGDRYSDQYAVRIGTNPMINTTVTIVISLRQGGGSLATTGALGEASLRQGGSR